MPVVLRKKRGQKIHKLHYEIFGMGYTFQRVLLLFTVNLSELLSALHKQSQEIITKCAAINCKFRWSFFNLKAESTHSILTYCCNQSMESAHQGGCWLRPGEYSVGSCCSSKLFKPCDYISACPSLLPLCLELSLFEERLFFPLLHQLVHCVLEQYCMPLSAQM